MPSLTVPYPPALNRYWRFVTIGGKGRVLLSKEARQYKLQVAALRAGASPVAGPIKLTLRIYRPRRAGDIDSTLKAALDALQGVLYENDSQIVELRAIRGDDKHNPRVEVDAEAA
jgi:crossover junction endodeoxyribonuclease RusA